VDGLLRLLFSELSFFLLLALGVVRLGEASAGVGELLRVVLGVESSSDERTASMFALGCREVA
jgi:hypothetical protein